MEIKKICVVGSGTMAGGIVIVLAQAGYAVTMRGSKDEYLQGAKAQVKKFLDGSVERGKMTKEAADATMARVKVTTNLEEAAQDADLVIESSVEDMEIKKRLIEQLEHICPPHTIFATNTSYLSITELSSASKRRDKFIGMHWFNPPPLMRLVEIASTLAVSEETIAAVVEVCNKSGKVPAVCKDSPGFVVNRILQPWYNEGMNILDEGVASAKDIDTAIKVGGGFRMGPLELRDLVGLDTAVKGTTQMYEQLKNDKFKPAQGLISRVRAGYLGRKTKKGFHDYE